MNRSNKWFIVGCVVFLVCLGLLVNWLAPSDESTEEPTDTPTVSATDEPPPDNLDVPRPFTLTAKQKADVTKVLRVYYASPSERKETPQTVKPLVTANFASELEHQWDGLMPNTKSTVKKLQLTGAAVIDGERRINASVTVVTTYIDKSKSTQGWSTTITITDDGKVGSLEDYPDEGG